METAPKIPDEATTEASPETTEPHKKVSARKEMPWDWVIASLCISFGVVGLRIVNDTYLWEKFQGDDVTEAVATLHHKQGSVRYKRGGSYLWHDLPKNEKPLVAGDTIFTGSDGQATVKIFDSGELELSSNSLVVVRPAEKGTRQGSWLDRYVKPLVGQEKAAASSLDIQKGRVKVTVGAEEGLAVHVGGKDYHLSAADGKDAQVQLALDEESNSLRLSSVGDASTVRVEDITEPGRILELRKDELGQITSDDQVTKVEARLAPVSPASRFVVVTDPEGSMKEASVKFQWSWVGSQNLSSATGVLKIKGKTESSIPFTGADTHAEVPLGAGAWKWRIEAAGEQTFLSEWQRFELVILRKPVLLGPVNGSIFKLSKGQKEVDVSFNWETVKNTRSVEFQYWRKEDTDRKVIPSGPNGAAIALPSGEYVWRIRTLHESGLHSPWSDGANLKVEKAIEGDESLTFTPLLPGVDAPAPAAAAPEIDAPSEKLASQSPEAKVAPAPPKKEAIEILPTFENISGSASTRLGSGGKLVLDRVPVTLRWKDVPKATHYEVDIFSDSSGKLLARRKVKDPELAFVIESLRNTSYQYKVRAFLTGGKKIESSMVKLNIELSSPVPKIPPKGTSVSVNQILLTWEKTALTDQYHIQIARDSKFRNKIVDELLDQNFYIFRSGQTGKFYWRLLSKTGKHESKWSYSSHFSFAQGE